MQFGVNAVIFRITHTVSHFELISICPPIFGRAISDSLGIRRIELIFLRNCRYIYDLDLIEVAQRHKQSALFRAFIKR